MKISGQRRLSRRQKQALRRRSAIEPEIGHVKNDGLLGRCYPKGTEGHAMNIIVCGCGLNLRKLLAYLRRHPLKRFFRPLFSAWPVHGESRCIKLCASDDCIALRSQSRATQGLIFLVSVMRPLPNTFSPGRLFNVTATQVRKSSNLLVLS